jgi:hypothetical protein
VDFHRSADRFSHCISARVNDEWRELFKSHEGQPDDPWPPSPPLQHLTMSHRDDNTPIALLLGSAGNSHWSMSVEPLDDPEGFSFDVACRWGSQPSRLGSEYTLGPDVSTRDTPNSIRLWLAGHEYSIEPIPIQGTICSALSAAGRAEISVQRTPDLPATARWRYALLLLPAPQ